MARYATIVRPLAALPGSGPKLLMREASAFSPSTGLAAIPADPPGVSTAIAAPAVEEAAATGLVGDLGSMHAGFTSSAWTFR